MNQFKIFGIAIMLMLQLISHAQDTKLKHLYYENSLGEKGKTTLYYSEEGKNHKAKWELMDGSRYSINYHFLDKNNNVIRKYREFSDSITSNNFYKYDGNGNLIEDYFERSDGLKGIAWYKYIDGKKIEAECRGLNGWFYGFIKYFYEDGKLTKGLIYKDGKETGYIEYEYDDEGKILTEYWNFGKWNQTFTYEYEDITKNKPLLYNYSSPFLKETQDYIVKSENYDWNNERGGPSIYEYEGNKLVRKTYKYDGLETITTYDYDDNGLLMKSFRNYSDGRKAEFFYHYNEQRQLIRRLFFGDNGFMGSETYHYDQIGRLFEANWTKYDTWLTGTILFTYDEKNALKSGLFKGEDSFDANISFEVDKNSNLKKIHWNFSFGKTQTYGFEYESIK